METNNNAIAVQTNAAILERVVIEGDLSNLTPENRVSYYRAVCESLGLNPLTKPFEYIVLDNKLVLYARRDATDQLRALKHVSVSIVARERMEDVYVVTARATTPDGRADESIGAVNITKEDGEWQTSANGRRYFKGSGNFAPLRGDALANALMKAETKAKRRATLSLIGLGILDETEIETIPDARPVPVDDTPRPSPQPAPKPTLVACPRRGACVGSGRIEPVTIEVNGRTVNLTADEVAAATEHQFGAKLCYACGQAEKKRRAEEPNPAEAVFAEQAPL